MSILQVRLHSKIAVQYSVQRTAGFCAIYKHLLQLAERSNTRRLIADHEAGDMAIHRAYMLHAATTSLAETLDYEAHLQDIAGRTADHREGVAAFLEKRKPGFTGK